MTQNIPLTWLVPVEDLPDKGAAIAFEAGPEARTALAAYAGVEAVDSLSAKGELRPMADGIEVRLHLKAAIVQACVVSLAPVRSVIEEEIVRRFLPPWHVGEVDSAPVEISPSEEDPPEPLTGDEVDLGPVLTEHFLLGINPYPRAPGATAPDETPRQPPEPSPFAVLKRLKDPG